MAQLLVLLSAAFVRAGLSLSPPPAGYSTLGILNATAVGVDNSGATDTTVALQSAIVAAYGAQLALFLPPGRYLVSDTLWANQSNYGSSLPVNLRPARWRTNVILGSTLNRPTIVLAPHTPGFGNASSPKNVLKLHNTGRENDHMNQLLRSVNVEIGDGNPGAVGVFLHGAQGSSVQDVTVFMTDALAGFGGGGGAGASHLNIAAFGGQYGVLFAESEPGPVVAGGRFENQSVSAVVWQVTSRNSIAQGPLIVAGVEIVQSTGARGPAVASPALYLLDAKIRCDEKTGVAVSTGGYLQRVYTKGCSLTRNATRGSPTGFTLINEMVAGDMWVDGKHHAAASIYNVGGDGSLSDAPDVVARHVRWNEATFPSFERADVANAVRDCGATGDGLTDDTGAIQECLSRFSKVFLPKGLYRINRTLSMRAGTALVGLSQTHSVIAPITAGFAASDAETAPLVRTSAGAPVTIAFVGLVTWWHVPGTFTLEWRANQGLWRSNYESRVCECMWLSDYGSPNAAHGKLGTWPPTNCTKGVELRVPKTQIKGTGFFYNYVSDEDVLYTDHTGYRDLLVSNTHVVKNGTDRTVFYAMNLEHAMSEANGEIAYASHVDILGLKKEGSTTVLWIRDSIDVNLYGTAGGYTALANASQYPADFAQYTPSIYRLERTSPVKLAITAYQRSGLELDERSMPATKVKCSFPLDDSQLKSGNFPPEDWTALKTSLWAPWCGYWVSGANVLVEADGATRTIVATPDAGVLYMRGHPTQQ